MFACGAEILSALEKLLGRKYRMIIRTLWRLHKIKINLKLSKRQNSRRTNFEMQLYLVYVGFSKPNVIKRL